MPRLHAKQYNTNLVIIGNISSLIHKLTEAPIANVLHKRSLIAVPEEYRTYFFNEFVYIVHGPRFAIRKPGYRGSYAWVGEYFM